MDTVDLNHSSKTILKYCVTIIIITFKDISTVIYLIYSYIGYPWSNQSKTNKAIIIPLFNLFIFKNRFILLIRYHCAFAIDWCSSITTVPIAITWLSFWDCRCFDSDCIATKVLIIDSIRKSYKYILICNQYAILILFFYFLTSYYHAFPLFRSLPHLHIHF